MPTPGRDESLIARLLDLSPVERAALLQRVSPDEPRTRDRLLAASDKSGAASDHSAAPEFSSDVVVRALESALELAPTEVAGARIGSYKLLQEIGEGGFGVVWMAA